MCALQVNSASQPTLFPMLILKVSSGYLLCVLVTRHCVFVHVPQAAAILLFLTLCCEKAERVKPVSLLVALNSLLIAHRRDTAYKYADRQQIIFSILMQQRLYTLLFSSTRHYSLVYVKKINSFLLAFILLLRITCFAPFGALDYHVYTV